MSQREEVLQLMSRQVDGRLSETEQNRLADLLRSDPQLVDLYADYMCLHGQLTWDAGRSVGLGRPVATADSEAGPANAPRSAVGYRLTAVAAALVALIGGWMVISMLVSGGGNVVVQPDLPGNPEIAVVPEKPPEDDITSNSSTADLKPLELTHRREQADVIAGAEPDQTTDGTADRGVLPDDFTDSELVAMIDTLIEAGWQEHDIQPADPALDSEWVRRSYLTVAGRIPTLAEAKQFLDDDSSGKRQALIEGLLSSQEHAGYLATMWTNLLIGRTETAPRQSGKAVRISCVFLSTEHPLDRHRQRTDHGNRTQ